MARKKISPSLLLLEYANVRIGVKKKLNKASTAELYQVAVNHFLFKFRKFNLLISDCKN